MGLTGLIAGLCSLSDQRVIAEGQYGGDWYESFAKSTKIKVPEEVKRISFFGSDLDLYVPGNERFPENFARPLSGEDTLEPEELAIFSVRTILVEDGRVFHRPELRHQGNNWVLDNFLAYVREQGGFDKVYDVFR